jgi:hypothetical protein
MAIWYIFWPFGIFFGHLVYFVAIWYILWPFGIFYGYLVYFSPFWYVLPRKIWQPCGRAIPFPRGGTKSPSKFRGSAGKNANHGEKNDQTEKLASVQKALNNDNSSSSSNNNNGNKNNDNNNNNGNKNNDNNNNNNGSFLSAVPFMSTS